MKDLNRWGAMLRQFRKRKGFTQDQLLDQLSLLCIGLSDIEQKQLTQLDVEIEKLPSKSDLSRYERGEREAQRPRQLFFIYGLRRLNCIESLWEANQWMELSANGNLSETERKILWGADEKFEQIIMLNRQFQLQEKRHLPKAETIGTIVEITMQRDFDTYTEEAYSQFGRALLELLHIEGVTIRAIATGSVRIFIEIPSDRVEALQLLFHTGKLQAYDVTAVRVLNEAEFAQIVASYENKHEALSTSRGTNRQGWFTALLQWSVIHPVWPVAAAALAILLLVILSPRRITPPTITETNPDARYMVAAVQGELLHSRPGWSDYQPVTQGALLEPNDTLRTGTDSVAQLVCADLSLVEIPADYNGPAPCPATAEPLLIAQPGTTDGRTMDSEPTCSELPILLSPRRTAVQTTQPLLQWQETTAPYTVAVSGADLQWATDNIDITELHYPTDAPPLQSDTRYRVTITDADGCQSSAENKIDLRFHLLSPEKVAEVEGHAAQIAQLDLPVDIEDALRAELYATYELRADAIDLLTEITATNTNPNLLRRLGDLYLAVIRYDAAQSAYEAALAQHQEHQDQAGAAAALVGLGQALYGQGEDALAIEQLRQAQALYSALGDDDGIEQVQVLLEDMGG
jgi:transcriptional regulator with XRE-family HTH domain